MINEGTAYVCVCVTNWDAWIDHSIRVVSVLSNDCFGYIGASSTNGSEPTDSLGYFNL